MPALAYSEDTVLDCEDVTDDEIRECHDLDQLQFWLDDFEALSADVNAQLTGYRSAGLNNLPWVYRAVQKLGYMGRGVQRVKRQMKALGHDPNPYGSLIDKLNKRIQQLRAESGVGIEFMRLAQEQLSADEFRALESAAVHALAQKLAKEAAEATRVAEQVERDRTRAP